MYSRNTGPSGWVKCLFSGRRGRRERVGQANDEAHLFPGRPGERAHEMKRVVLPSLMKTPTAVQTLTTTWAFSLLSPNLAFSPSLPFLVIPNSIFHN